MAILMTAGTHEGDRALRRQLYFHPLGLDPIGKGEREPGRKGVLLLLSRAGDAFLTSSAYSAQA